MWGVMRMAAATGVAIYGASFGGEYSSAAWFIAGFLTCATFTELLNALAARQT